MLYKTGSKQIILDNLMLLISGNRLLTSSKRAVFKNLAFKSC